MQSLKVYPNITNVKGVLKMKAMARVMSTNREELCISF